MEKQNYYLGLDMGTSSVGWAVTDKQYRLLRFKGKDLWGIREFDEASTAAARRANRVSRRRRQREQVRIGLLKSYFADEMEKVDPNFYQRLENSKYHLEDKDENVKNPNGIFNDPDFKDKDYYGKYKTIFHLRSELIHNSEPHDVRLVYLALLNMFKHRGHFLNAGLSSDNDVSISMKTAYDRLIAVAEELELDSIFKLDANAEKIEEILSSRDLSRSKKAEELAVEMLTNPKDKNSYNFVKLLCGLKVDTFKLFKTLEDDEDSKSKKAEEKKKAEISFSDFSDDKILDIVETVGEDNYELIEAMKDMYEIGSLAGVLKGNSYLSDARVADYEKHKEDLKVLKAVVKKYCSDEKYDEMFRSETDGTYSAYVNSFNSNAKQRRNYKKRVREELYSTVKNFLKDADKNDEQVQYIFSEIEKEAFLPKQLTASNGIIPNQVHVKELKKILSNAEGYLPFLTEKDESGLSVSERIIRLFTFQIPYYVGPVSENSAKNGGNGWVVRKESGQVLPWNIKDKVDLKATSEEFVKRLVRNCTYISGEKVLPKASLEYEVYCVLNEINKIKLKGEAISVELKQEIFTELFEKGKRITKKELAKFLKNKAVIDDELDISGIDIAINNSLSSFGKFKDVFGDKIKEDRYKHIAERIIFLSTVHGESKKMIKDSIEAEFGAELTKEQIKRILGYKFNDWGKLSKEFLELQGCDKSTGEMMSLIRAMWETNYNLMELINSDRFTFKEELESKKNKELKLLSEFTVEDLNDMYFSAPVKRMIWQTVLIIRELSQILGGEPERIFVEMTREDGEKGKRVDSRKRKFLDLYKNIKDEERDWAKFIEDADANGTLKSKKMYLYLSQMGKDMYTGKPIDLDQLFNDNLYDIDHIYPRHFVKDDNIGNNMVLVYKPDNAHKRDTYPLDKSIFDNAKVRALWEELAKKELISSEKYKRLTRRTPFTEEERADFIARQLVETSQAAKGVSDILNQLMPNTEFVYSKASNVSDFRNTYKLLKSRTVNDFHHAQDAYLNIVVGNAYFVKFTKNPMNFIKKEYEIDSKKNNYNLGKMFESDITRGNEIGWLTGKKEGSVGTIVTVKEMMSKNTPLMTRYSFVGHGEIANATLYSARKAKDEGYIPLKGSDPKMADVQKYGGFSSVSTAYFFLVEHDVKKKRVRTIETVPVYLADKIEANPDALGDYCKNTLGLVNHSVRLKKIKIQSLINKDGYLMHLSGKTGKQLIMRNSVSLCLKQEWVNYVKKIEKINERGSIDALISKEKNQELYDTLISKHKEGIFSKKPNPLGELLISGRDKFEMLEIEKQCGVLGKILTLTSIGTFTADLTDIGGASNCGKLLINKTISNFGEIRLINQSVTGVYEKPIDLLTI